MRKFRLLMISAITLLAAAPALAGPFGVQMGAPISSLQGAKPSKVMGEVTIYSVTTVPNSNPEFTSYLVWASDKTGICKISGIGKNHSGDASGVEVRQVFSDLSSLLSEKYGSSKLYDFLHAGALWDEPGEFAMSLAREERSLSRFWDEESKAKLPSDISSIMLEGMATNRDTTYVSLRYELGNFAACSELLDKAKGAGL